MITNWLAFFSITRPVTNPTPTCDCCIIGRLSDRNLPPTTRPKLWGETDKNYNRKPPFLRKKSVTSPSPQTPTKSPSDLTCNLNPLLHHNQHQPTSNILSRNPLATPILHITFTTIKMATSPTRADLLALSYNSQGFVPQAEETRQPTFLPLTPTTGTSYPTTQISKPSVAAPQASIIAHQPPVAAQGATASDVRVAFPVGPAADVTAIDMGLKTRRSSSLSSDGSASNGTLGRRFLKLGPVHGGEGEGDWSEDVVAE